MRSSWGKDLNRYSRFSHRKVFRGITQSIHNLDIDFNIDKKANFALLDLNKDAKLEPVYFNSDSGVQAELVDFELDRSVQKESVKVEFDRGAKIGSAKVELDSNIQAEQVNYETDRVTKIEPIDFELNGDAKAKLVDLLPASQIFSTWNDTNVAVGLSPQIIVANVNPLMTPFKRQSENDKQLPKSSLIPYVDFAAQDFSAKRLFTSLSDLIDNNTASSQSFLPCLVGFDSLIKPIISTPLKFSLSKKQSLENLDGAFDKPDHLFEWSRLALDNATLSTSGPTTVTRLFQLLTTSM